MLSGFDVPKITIAAFRKFGLPELIVSHHSSVFSLSSTSEDLSWEYLRFNCRLTSRHANVPTRCDRRRGFLLLANFLYLFCKNCRYWRTYQISSVFCLALLPSSPLHSTLIWWQSNNWPPSGFIVDCFSVPKLASGRLQDGSSNSFASSALKSHAKKPEKSTSRSIIKTGDYHVHYFVPRLSEYRIARRGSVCQVISYSTFRTWGRVVLAAGDSKSSLW